MVIEYPSINHLDLTEQTYRFLKDRILKREIKPGDKISVEDVAHGLGVSRTPVVSALKILESDGLVEIQPRRGTFVTHLTAKDVSDLFEIRLLIELHSARRIFQEKTVEQFLSQIEEPMSRMQAAIADDAYIDYDTFIMGDRDLHMNLVRFLDNHRLVQIYTDLNVHMQVARAHYLDTVENALEAQKEHEAMLLALQTRDLDGLEKALTEHILNVKVRILAMLDERGGRL
ncbi:MAG: GntR family transcriptional regulator [Anaerolineales bacterium]